MVNIELIADIIRYKLGVRRPLFSQLIITEKCNLNCKFCFIPKETRLKGKEYSYESITETLQNLKKIGVKYVTLTGGEPLLHKDLIRIVKYAKKMGFHINISTNGTLLDIKKLNELCRYVDAISISIDGLRKTHDLLRGCPGLFDKIYSVLKSERIKRSKCKIQVTSALSKININEIIELSEKLKPFIDSFKIQPIHLFKSIFPEKDNVDKFVGALLEKKKKDPLYYANNILFIKLLKRYFKGEKIKICDAGKLYILTYPDGKIFPCARFTMYDKIFSTSEERPNFDPKKLVKKCNGCMTLCNTEISLLFRSPLSEFATRLNYLIREYIPRKILKTLHLE